MFDPFTRRLLIIAAIGLAIGIVWWLLLLPSLFTRP